MWSRRETPRPMGEMRKSSGEGSSASVSTAGSSGKTRVRGGVRGTTCSRDSLRERSRSLSSNSSGFGWCRSCAAEAGGGSDSSDSTCRYNRCFTGRSSRRGGETGDKRCNSDTEGCVSLRRATEERETMTGLSNDERSSSSSRRRRTCSSCCATLRTTATISSSIACRNKVIRRRMSRTHVGPAYPESSSSHTLILSVPDISAARSTYSDADSSITSSSRPQQSGRRGNSTWRSAEERETLSSSTSEALIEQKRQVFSGVSAAAVVEGDRRRTAENVSSGRNEDTRCLTSVEAEVVTEEDTWAAAERRIDDAEGQARGERGRTETIVVRRSTVERNVTISSTCCASSLSLLSLTCPLAFMDAMTATVLALQQQQQFRVLCTAELLLHNFVRKYEAFIFDIDGVLLMGKRPLAGVAEGLSLLREQGKRLLFLTNSASKSRRMCVQVLRKAGIFAEFHEVICSSYATALHLQVQYPHIKKVFMIGEAGLEEELREAGFEVLHAAGAAVSHSRRIRELRILAADTQSAAEVAEAEGIRAIPGSEVVKKSVSGESPAVPSRSLTESNTAEPSAAEDSSSPPPHMFLSSAADRYSDAVVAPSSQQTRVAFVAPRLPSSTCCQASPATATSSSILPPSSVSSVSFISAPCTTSTAPHYTSAATSTMGSDAPVAASQATCFSSTSVPSAAAVPLNSCSSFIEDEESFTSLAHSLDPEVGAVVIGWDRRFDYFKLAVASLYLHRGDNTLPFLAANKDAFDVVDGWRIPANGAAVAALETAAGRPACCVGKPSPWLAETVVRLHGLDVTSTVVCGDRLDTDVAFGKHAGTATCVTLTGCTTPQQLLEMRHSHPLRPDAVCPHVGLLRLLKGNTTPPQPQ